MRRLGVGILRLLVVRDRQVIVLGVRRDGGNTCVIERRIVLLDHRHVADIVYEDGFFKHHD